jgi:hypothetical protein
MQEYKKWMMKTTNPCALLVASSRYSERRLQPSFLQEGAHSLTHPFPPIFFSAICNSVSRAFALIALDFCSSRNQRNTQEPNTPKQK